MTHKDGQMARYTTIVVNKELHATRIDDVLTDFQQKMQSMGRRWPRFWQLRRMEEIHMPLCDMMNGEDEYELQVGVQDVEKDKLEIKATVNGVEISGKHLDDIEEKKKYYIYNKRFLGAFFKTLLPDEACPSKVSTKMIGSVRTFELTKKVAMKSKKTTRVAIE
jgi:HSP20 family molecular chaperone IbpA